MADEAIEVPDHELPCGCRIVHHPTPGAVVVAADGRPSPSPVEGEFVPCAEHAPKPKRAKA